MTSKPTYGSQEERDEFDAALVCPECQSTDLHHRWVTTSHLNGKVSYTPGRVECRSCLVPTNARSGRRM